MKFTLLLSIALTLLGNQLWAQQPVSTIEGHVYTEDGQPVQGASIDLLPTHKKTLTDADGKFKLTTSPGRYALIVSFLGKQVQRQEVELLPAEGLELPNISLKDSAQQLEEYIITGQLAPQSLKRTVYQVRVISQEQIRLRGATNLQTVLNTELGIRFSNDLTLGTSDIQLLGMSGQNVKILLDGIPMLDRGATRESLGQVDINHIERIEIVEGPMSVMYGTDALAGVINIISKQAQPNEKLSLTARLQEETTGGEYHALNASGVHNANIGINYQHKAWNFGGSVSRNNFGGWQGTNTGRAKAWMPKQQWLGTAGIGYKKGKLDLWYRFNGTDEDLNSLGNINTNNQIAADKNYLSTRWFHQAQGLYRASDRLQLSLVGSFTDYSRKTQSTNLDFITGKRTLSTETGSQDRSTFKTSFGRATTVYQVSNNLTLLAGMDISHNQSSGARIQMNAPAILEYAIFLSPEIKIGSKIQIRPGLRFLKNSQYDAPPIVPGLNTRLRLNKHMDLRLGYARGFRSPDLRELYFSFFDASHSIQGNPDLKAEHSNSFNGSLTTSILSKPNIRWNSTLGAFYNIFQDLIGTAVLADSPSITTYINIQEYKTTGGSWNNQIAFRQMMASVGLQYVGRYNQYQSDQAIRGESNQFSWTPEINTSVSYQIKKTGTTLALAYKHTGRQPIYELGSEERLTLIKRAAYNMADFTVTQKLGHLLHLNGGIRNVLNVTNINSGSTQTSGDGHSTAGSIPLAYGRSYFLGLAFNWTKSNQ